jgi:hypothetical protein
MERNRYAPPEARVGDVHGAPAPKYLAVIIAALSAIHLLVFFTYFSAYFVRVNLGEIRGPYVLPGLAGEVVLLVGVVMLLFKRYSKWMFAVSGALFLLSIGVLWRELLSRSDILLPNGLGAAVAFFGWRTIIRLTKGSQD